MTAALFICRVFEIKSIWTYSFVKHCMTAVYVHNRSPHKTFRNMTPEEAFTRVKPKVGHFNIFGCSVYIHVPKEKWTKLDPSGRKGTFVGYSESSKAYWIYILGQRQIEVSIDVTFEEEVAFMRSRGSHMDIDSEKQEEMVPSPPLVDVPRYIVVGQKRPTWTRQTLQEVERHASPHGTF
jgi:hypothetical protein